METVKRNKGAKTSPVKITKADGTVEYRAAYDLLKLRRAMRTRRTALKKAS